MLLKILTVCLCIQISFQKKVETIIQTPVSLNNDYLIRQPCDPRFEHCTQKVAVVHNHDTPCQEAAFRNVLLQALFNYARTVQAAPCQQKKIIHAPVECSIKQEIKREEMNAAKGLEKMKTVEIKKVEMIPEVQAPVSEIKSVKTEINSVHQPEIHVVESKIEKIEPEIETIKTETIEATPIQVESKKLVEEVARDVTVTLKPIKEKKSVAKQFAFNDCINRCVIMSNMMRESEETSNFEISLTSGPSVSDVSSAGSFNINLDLSSDEGLAASNFGLVQNEGVDLHNHDSLQHEIVNIDIPNHGPITVLDSNDNIPYISSENTHSEISDANIMNDMKYYSMSKKEKSVSTGKNGNIHFTVKSDTEHPLIDINPQSDGGVMLHIEKESSETRVNPSVSHSNLEMSSIGSMNNYKQTAMKYGSAMGDVSNSQYEYITGYQPMSNSQHYFMQNSINQQTIPSTSRVINFVEEQPFNSHYEISPTNHVHKTEYLSKKISAGEAFNGMNTGYDRSMELQFPTVEVVNPINKIKKTEYHVKKVSSNSGGGMISNIKLANAINSGMNANYEVSAERNIVPVNKVKKTEYHVKKVTNNAASIPTVSLDSTYVEDLPQRGSYMKKEYHQINKLAKKGNVDLGSSISSGLGNAMSGLGNGLSGGLGSGLTGGLGSGLTGELGSELSEKLGSGLSGVAGGIQNAMSTFDLSGKGSQSSSLVNVGGFLPSYDVELSAETELNSAGNGELPLISSGLDINHALNIDQHLSSIKNQGQEIVHKMNSYRKE